MEVGEVGEVGAVRIDGFRDPLHQGVDGRFTTRPWWHDDGALDGVVLTDEDARAATEWWLNEAPPAREWPLDGPAVLNGIPLGPGRWDVTRVGRSDGDRWVIAKLDQALAPDLAAIVAEQAQEGRVHVGTSSAWVTRRSWGRSTPLSIRVGTETLYFAARGMG